MHVVLPYYIHTPSEKGSFPCQFRCLLYMFNIIRVQVWDSLSAAAKTDIPFYSRMCIPVNKWFTTYIHIYITTVIGKAPIPLAAPPRRAFSQAPLLKVAMRTFQVEGLDSAQQEGLSGKEGSLAYVSGRPRPSVCPDMAASTVESLPTLTLE